MTLLAAVLVGFVALLHVGFLVLEMFLFRTPFGQKTFQLTKEQAEQMAPLAANQGLYNGFLAAGLIWSLFLSEPMAFQVKVFFLSCVIVAGIYGGLTVKRSILFLQMTPGAVALAVVFAAARAVS